MSIDVKNSISNIWSVLFPEPPVNILSRSEGLEAPPVSVFCTNTTASDTYLSDAIVQ